MLLGNNPFPQDPRVRPEARALGSAGWEVTVICPRAAGQPRAERVDGVDVRRFRLPFEGRSALGLVVEHLVVAAALLVLAVWHVRRRGADVVHLHNPPDTLVVAAYVLKALGLRVVYDHHDLAPEIYAAHARGEPRPAVLRALIALETASCRVADHVVTTNESHKRLEVQRAGIPAEKVTVVRNGPDLERFRPAAADAGVREGAGYLVGWAGSMGFHDGIDHLLRAMRAVVAEAPDSRCLLVGGGEALDESRALAHELGLDAHVTFTGQVGAAEVPHLLNACDVCAVADPSNPYNDRCTMIKVMEYMALAKPVVAYDLPETRASAGDAAVYVVPDRPDLLAEALLALREDPRRRAELGARGRRRVEEGLSWAHSVPALLGVYAALGTSARESST